MDEILPEDKWTRDNIEDQLRLITRALGIAQKANDPTMRRYYYNLEGRALDHSCRLGVVPKISAP